MANPPADISGAVYVVTYVEAMPRNADAALDVLRQIRDAKRGNGGCQRCDLLERLAQPNQFVLLEAWQSEGSAAGPVDEHLQPLLLSPCDVRTHTGFAVGPANDSPAEALSEGCVYVVTHVDVVPPHKDEGVALLADLVEPSRGEVGNLGFEVWQQTGRPNHLTVVETWRDQAALDDHAMSEPVRRFRRQLTPLSGALYDQRLFRAVG